MKKKHRIEPKPPLGRCEHARAKSDLPHFDSKKFARMVKAGHRIMGGLRGELLIHQSKSPGASLDRSTETKGLSLPATGPS